MKRKATVVLATMVFGTVMFLGPNVDTSCASDCYASDAMYGEGPAVNCQKNSDKVKISRDVTSVYDEGLSTNGQGAELQGSRRLIAKSRRNMDGDMFSEGMTNNSLRSMELVALRTRILQAKPAAGH